MAGSIESTVVIERPVDEVFSYVLDLAENGPSWAPDLESVTQTSDGPVGAGTSFEQVQTVMGKRRNSSLQFTAVETNNSIEAAANVGPLAPTARVTFEEADGGTRLTIRGDANPKGVFKLLSPVMAKQGQRMWDARLAQLKSVLEASGNG
jgi:uncharacterized membrane protein